MVKSSAWRQVEAYFQSQKLIYQIYSHPPTFRVADAQKYSLSLPGLGTKSLFLKTKDRIYYLYVLPGQRRADLKKLSQELGVKRLSFARPEEMEKILGVRPGSLSPASLINDIKERVNLVIDSLLLEAEAVNFHPNDNRASLVVDKDNFRRFLRSLSRDYKIVKASG